MDTKRRVHLSKFLSKHLRHAPEAIGLTLGDGGWVPVADVLAASARAGVPITRDELNAVVAGCDKQRFALDEVGDRVRANQGHSVEVDLELSPAAPPAVLYHGTAERNRAAILAGGLSKMRRHHVHLSADVETATRVGTRHGKPLVFTVDAAAMAAAGHAFFVSANGVWLVDHVPAQYLHAPA